MKNLSIATAFLLGSLVKSTAQMPMKAMNATSADETAINTAIGQLENSALEILLFVVIVLSLLGISAILMNCIGHKKTGKITRITLFLLLAAAALPFISAGCSVETMAQAETIHAVKLAEGGVCVCPNMHYYRQSVGASWPNSQYSHVNYRQSTGSPFCRQCGLRIQHGNR